MTIEPREGLAWQARRGRKRVPIDALKLEGLFLLLTKLRAANAQSLFDLYFKPRDVTLRTAMRRLHDLVDAGYLAHLRLDNARCIYHLTEKTCSLTPAIELRSHSALYNRPPDRQAAYCWLRSTLFALLVEKGYSVGNDPAAVYALRRFLIDNIVEGMKRAAREKCVADLLPQNLEWMRRTPALRALPGDQLLGYRTRCRDCGAEGFVTHHVKPGTTETCNGKVRAAPATTLDIAWKRSDGRYEAMIVFIDNPTLSLDEQLKTLGQVTPGFPRMPVIVRTTDPRSRFDVTRNAWVAIGPRHVQLRTAFFHQRRGPFYYDCEVVDPWPNLQACSVRDPKSKVVTFRDTEPKSSARGDAHDLERKVARERDRERGRDADHDREPLREEVRRDERERVAAEAVVERSDPRFAMRRR